MINVKLPIHLKMETTWLNGVDGRGTAALTALPPYVLGILGRGC